MIRFSLAYASRLGFLYDSFSTGLAQNARMRFTVGVVFHQSKGSLLMSMLGYFDVFPEKMQTEIRTAIIPNDAAETPFPSGTYLFTEFFCTDPKCDCQRVLVKVLRAESRHDTRPEEVATISYSWDPDGEQSMELLDPEMPNPFLDPFHRQAPYAQELLDFWSGMIAYDEEYASRIERHYHEIRAEVGQPAGEWARQRSSHVATSKRPGRPLARHNRRVRKKRVARARKR